MKRKILEYYNGNPDNSIESDSGQELTYIDSDAIAFGFFPINLDKDYEFLSGTTTHRSLANKAAMKIVGKALSHISPDYVNDWMTTEAYDKSYGLGRLWKNTSVISFWEAPCYELLIDILNRLGINNPEVWYVADDGGEFMLDEYIKAIKQGYYDIDDYAEKKAYRIDSKVADAIKSYNNPAETWQSQKEREGWKSLAQRNATLYQEGKEPILEYFAGDPDTMSEYDDETKQCLRNWYYSDDPGISFGWFQTSLDGGKEFVAKKNTCHYDLTQNIGRNILGKAIRSEDFDEDDIKGIGYAVNDYSAYKGRTFSEPKIITTWHKVSSEKLAEIVDLLGGVDKFADYCYVNPKEYSYGNNEGVEPNSMNVVEYINANISYVSPIDEKKMKQDIKGTYFCQEWVIDIIREYNTPNSALAAKTAKLGDMTIAQYNSLIHQEGKEPKQTIKENDINMKNNKYQEEFSNYISIMTEALQKGDYKAYDYAKEMLDEAIEDSKHEDKLAAELNTNNFGILNHIFEERLPELFKNNKKAVRNVIKLIKEDNNLSSQFNFYNAIRNYHGKIAEILKPEDLAHRLYEAIVPTINRETLMESNAKFRKILKENNIIPTDFISDEMKTLYESGHNILTKKRSVGNVATLAESTNNICEYMIKHKDDNIKEGIDPNKLVENFENKLKDTLTESEMSFVQQITDFRSPIAEQRKEKLFNKFKNECIDKINTMLKEDENNVELKALSEQISGMQFNKESIVKDIAKLLEIRDILMDD